MRERKAGNWLGVIQGYEADGGKETNRTVNGEQDKMTQKDKNLEREQRIDSFSGKCLHVQSWPS